MTDILSRLSPPDKSRKSRKRVGRGPGSGVGKTSGRGHNGQNSRSGGGVRPGFEGGQMPLHRRLPKRGFKNRFKKEIAIVNVGSLGIFRSGKVVDEKALLESGLVKKVKDGIKILGKGELKKKLVVRTQFASAGAILKINNAGGSYEEIL